MLKIASLMLAESTRPALGLHVTAQETAQDTAGWHCLQQVHEVCTCNIRNYNSNFQNLKANHNKCRRGTAAAGEPARAGQDEERRRSSSNQMQLWAFAR